MCPQTILNYCGLSSKNGEELWRANILNPWGWLALNETTVFYLNQFDVLEAFNLSTGEKLWSRKLGDYFGWLHAGNNYLIVGGWRDYTDLHCLDTATGEICWTFPAKNRKVIRTFISASQSSAGIAFGDTSELILVDFNKGIELNRLFLEGMWAGDNIDYIPVSHSGSWQPLETHLIFKAKPNSLYRVDSNSLSVEHIELGEDIYSKSLQEYSGSVPFQGPNSILNVFNLYNNQLSKLDVIHHNRKDVLPVLFYDERHLFLGTSFGLLHQYIGTNLVSKTKVGKRVSTQLGFSGGHLCFGTASGEVVGIRLE